LAILDQGRLVADGVPDDLMRDVGATVVQIESELSRRIRNAIIELPEVWHVAQLGNRLHALVRPDLADPVAMLQRRITPVDGNAQVQVIAANLEDVFVMATEGAPDAE
jgi:ABC-2 type transport system ATP-binding protein